METIDWIIVVVLALGFIAGLVRGLVRQAFSIGGLIIGVLCGAFLYKPVAGFLLNGLNMTEKVAQVLAFIVILMIVPILFGLLGRMISKLVHVADLGFVDRLLGGVIGTFKWFILLGLLFQLMDMTNLTDKVMKNRESKEKGLYPTVRDGSDFCLRWVWNKVKDNVELPDFRSDGEDNSDSKSVGGER